MGSDTNNIHTCISISLILVEVTVILQLQDVWRRLLDLKLSKFDVDAFVSGYNTFPDSTSRDVIVDHLQNTS